MDSTTLGVILTCVAGLVGSLVVYVGKRGENITTRFNSEIDQVQEERNGLLQRVAERDLRLVEKDGQISALQEQRRLDLLRITRLEIQIIHLGGEPEL